jgi:hypothetical protein
MSVLGGLSDAATLLEWSSFEASLILVGHPAGINPEHTQASDAKSTQALDGDGREKTSMTVETARKGAGGRMATASIRSRGEPSAVVATPS